MKTVSQLPEDYREVYSVNLETNKKSSLYVNLLAIAITVSMAVIMSLVIPISSLFENHTDAAGLIIRFLVLIAMILAHIVLHELTHGVVMKLCGCEKVTYGFSGMYAYASASAFFTKTQYLCIALAPVFFWGIVLTVLGLLVPTSWFWIIYTVQIANIAGAAGDYYVVFHFFFLPEDLLVYDTGTSMSVYAPQAKKQEE